jgi:hypothetical protein
MSPKNRMELIRRSRYGAVAGPMGELMFLRDYWQPESVLYVQIGQFPFMIEAIIFGWCIAGIVTMFYLIVTKKYLVSNTPKGNHKLVISYFVILFIFVLIFCLFFGLNSLYASAFALSLSAMYLVYIRKDLFMLSIFSGLFTTAVIFVCYALLCFFVGNVEELLKEIWLLYETPLDIRVFNCIPISELIFGFSLGLCIGPLHAFIHQMRVTNDIRLLQIGKTEHD